MLNTQMTASPEKQALLRSIGDILPTKTSAIDSSNAAFFQLNRASSDPDVATRIQPQSLQQRYVGKVGANAADNFYVFRLKQDCVFTLKLHGLTADADVVLLNRSGRVVRSSLQADTATENLTIALDQGTYYIRVHATEGETGYQMNVAADSSRRALRRHSTEGFSRDNVVLDWNQVALDAVTEARKAPPIAARNLAIVHTAVYDAVNSIVRQGTRYHVQVNAPRSASVIAAAAQAAYDTLVALYPTQTARFDSSLARSLDRVRDGRAEDDGRRVGRRVAQAILDWRRNDGSTAIVPYTPLGTVGTWRPTPNGFASAVLPSWSNVMPFAIASNTQFAPGAPPRFDSAQYARELQFVRRIGARDSTERTAEQTEIARFWADLSGSFLPPGHWNAIATEVARDQKTTLFEEARSLALLNVALADAGITCWTAKYSYNQWRPITAIRDTTPGLGWRPDPNWIPLLETPPFPDFTSGHSTFSASAATILSALFGESFRFSATSASTTPTVVQPGLVRHYDSFWQAAEEAGMSRLYGGIHVMSSNRAGLECGEQIGHYVFNCFLNL